VKSEERTKVVDGERGGVRTPNLPARAVTRRVWLRASTASRLRNRRLMTATIPIAISLVKTHPRVWAHSRYTTLIQVASSLMASSFVKKVDDSSCTHVVVVSTHDTHGHHTRHTT
jgi:hypothetical protein